jgi:hypothetical protein
MGTTPNDPGVYLDGMDLDPKTDAWLTKGAAFYRISRERFAAHCVDAYVNGLLDTNPEFLATAVELHVINTIAESPNAAEHFELK